MDPETGLYYFNQRYYDPSLGRFLTEDPAGQGLNPYAYAGNSPLMYVDPDGEFFWIVGMIIGAVAANWGKDLSRPNMLGETLMGAAIGAAAGAGLDFVAANAGLRVKVVADLPYVGQVNLASMDFVGPGLVGAGAAALAGRDQFRQDQFNAQERAHDMTGEFDSYYQTGGVESDFCYPCGGGMEDFQMGEQIRGRNSNDNKGMDPYAREAINKYGPDTLGIIGSGLQMVPHPGVRVVGGGLVYTSMAWGSTKAYSNYNELSTGEKFFSVLNLAPPYSYPIFGITRGSASLIYSVSQ
jgi:hypothetical protein